MLKELIEKGLFAIVEEPMGWQDAIRASVRPLVENGACTSEYAEVIIENVKKYGPYIVIAPELALPHAEDCAHVNRSAVCFVKFNHPVSFAEEETNPLNPAPTARLFFALSSEDELRHLRNLRALTTECLRNPGLIDRLCQAATKEEMLAALTE